MYRGYMPRTWHPERRGRGLRAAVVALVCLYTFHCIWTGRPDEGQSSGVQAPPLAFIPAGLGNQVGPPLGALLLGCLLYACRGESMLMENAAIILVYFGTQTFMSIYVKVVFSALVIDEEEGLKGIPMGFLVTSIQQFTAFLMFGCFALIGRLCQTGYKVRKLTTTREYIAVLCFGMAFALNIGLNNFSLSLVAISINMIIRSCMPLATAVSQILLGSAMGLKKAASISPTEWLLMLIGVGCAAMATFAKNAASGGSEESSGLVLGVAVCVASIFSGALNMVLASALGSEMKLNPVDSTCYMSLPAGLVLLIPGLFVSHPMGTWQGFPSMTDWQVLAEVVARNPLALTPVFLSGILAFVYNILQYGLVHKLSASYAAFCGNFNKAATVAISLMLGLEAVPAGNHGYLFILAIAGNIMAFTLYSAVKARK